MAEERKAHNWKRDRDILGGDLSDEDRTELGEGNRLGHDLEPFQIPSPTDDSFHEIVYKGEEQGDWFSRDVGSRRELNYKQIVDHGLSGGDIFGPSLSDGKKPNLPGNSGEELNARHPFKPIGRGGRKVSDKVLEGEL